MNSPEHCGTDQGNGKDAKPVQDDLVNDWLLEGYASANGWPDCSVDVP